MDGVFLYVAVLDPGMTPVDAPRYTVLLNVESFRSRLARRRRGHLFALGEGFMAGLVAQSAYRLASHRPS